VILPLTDKEGRNGRMSLAVFDDTSAEATAGSQAKYLKKVKK
jgi:hypothetical protein